MLEARHLHQYWSARAVPDLPRTDDRRTTLGSGAVEETVVPPAVAQGGAMMS